MRFPRITGSDLVVDETESNKASKQFSTSSEEASKAQKTSELPLNQMYHPSSQGSMSLSIDRGDETVASMFTQNLSANAKQTPFRFSSTDIRCSVQGEELVVESAHELRLVRIDLNGNIHTHGHSNPLRIQPNEKAIIENCIIQWHLPS